MYDDTLRLLEKMNIPKEDIEFLKNEGLEITDAYLGMLRVFWYPTENNPDKYYRNCVWQTSLGDVLKRINEDRDKPKSRGFQTPKELAPQFREFLEQLKMLEPEVRKLVYMGHHNLGEGVDLTKLSKNYP